MIDTRPAAASESPTPEHLVQRAASLVPLLRDRAAQAERDRMVSADTISMLREAGLFRVLQPKRFGGLEFDFVALAHLVSEISRGCGSTGWVFGVLALHQWVVGTFPLEAQEEVWADDPGALISGTYVPTGKVEEVDGGYRISGRWPFASGCDHASWHLVGTMLPPRAPGQAPAGAFLLLRRADFSIEDDWHTMGLSATGSKKVVVDGAFVPRHRVLPFRDLLSGDAPGAAVHGGFLYRLPYLTVVPISIAPTTLGMVQGMLEEVIELASVRTIKAGVYRGKRLADSVHVQSRVSEGAACLDAARLLLLRSLGDTMTAARQGKPISVEMRVLNRRDYAMAVRLCVQAADALYACFGASGLYTTNRAQRSWRDVHAAEKHIGLSWDTIGPMYGQFVLGLEPQGQY